ncbi:MAG TPA: hypothetical protein VGO00_07285 [Kofleriaceae bacterium]|nr:hypothetical protein [Kofleriaceae bacterium]
MTRCLLIAMAIAGTAAADTPKLDAARAALDAVHFPEAQRLLGEALAQGGNSPTDMREIYRLAAKAEAALGHPDVAEQFYRRWLALDPHASLAAGDSPKLQAPFAAARAFVQANGGLVVHLEHGVDVDVSIVGDPLAMAVAVARGPDPAVPLATDRHAHLADGPGAIAVLDDRGNHLIEVDVPAAVAPPREYPPPIEAPRPGGWKVWAIGAGAFTAIAFGFGATALAFNNDGSGAASNSGAHFFSDVETDRDRARLFAYMSAGAFAIGIGLAIPALHYYPNSLRAVVTGNGVAVAGGF